MKKTTKKTAKKRVKKEKYVASVKVLGKVYSSTGDSVQEALQNLKPLGVVRGYSILSVSIGDKKRERILSSMATTRLFSPSPLMRSIALKNTSLLF